jgi:frataxin-like iron-binding protein CyaY
MKTVANPNGVGEEYEIDLLVSGKILNITIDDQGKIISETGQDQYFTCYR